MTAMQARMIPTAPGRNGRRAFLFTGAAWLLSGMTVAVAVDPRLLRRGAHRVQPLCSLPEADYQHGARSPSAIVRSQLAIPLTRPELISQAIAAIRDALPSTASRTPAVIPTVPCINNPAVGDVTLLQQLAMRDYSQSLINAATIPQAKLILLGQRELAVLHCEISDVALLVEANGAWHMSFRADQNPRSRRNDQVRNLELHIKRNAFHVNVRLLHSSRPGGEAISATQLTGNPIDQAGKLAVAQLKLDDFWVEREAPEFILREGFEPGIARHFEYIDQAEVEFFVRLDPLTGNGRGVVDPWQREP